MKKNDTSLKTIIANLVEKNIGSCSSNEKL